MSRRAALGADRDAGIGPPAGLVLTIIGIQDPLSANPQAFLLGLLWLLVVSVRLAIRPGTGTSAGQASGRADARVTVSA